MARKHINRTHGTQNAYTYIFFFQCVLLFTMVPGNRVITILFVYTLVQNINWTYALLLATAQVQISYSRLLLSESLCFQFVYPIFFNFAFLIFRPVLNITKISGNLFPNKYGYCLHKPSEKIDPYTLCMVYIYIYMSCNAIRSRSECIV